MPRTTCAGFNFSEKGAGQGKLVTQSCRSVVPEGCCAKWADATRNWSNSKLLEPYLTRTVMAAFAVPTSHPQEAMRALVTAGEVLHPRGLPVLKSVARDMRPTD